jgi:hypothetical protein
MAKLTDDVYPRITSAASGDLLMVVDVDNDAQSPEGSTATITVGDLLSPGTGSLSGLAPSGDDTGATDTANVQGLLNLAGKVILQAGLFWYDQTIQLGSGTTWEGAGPGLTVNRAVASWSPSQVGSNTGALMVATAGNAAQSDITIRGMTFDGNQQNISAVPSYADAPETAPLGLWNVTGLRIEDVEVINAIGYSIYVKFSTRVWITRPRVLSGQGGSSWNQQDGIHVADSSQVEILDPDVDTGTGTAGDDGIAIQSYTGVSDVIIRGGFVRSAAHGVALALSGGSISNVLVDGVDIWGTHDEAVIAYWDTGTVGAFTNIVIRGCPSNDIGTSTSGSIWSVEAPFTDFTIEGCTCSGFNNTSGNGFFIRNSANTTPSKNLNLNHNTISGFAGTSLALIGEGGCGITGVNINDNTLDGTAASTLDNGIILSDSTDGSVSDNTILGVTTGSSYGIQIYGEDTAPTGLCINSNRVKGWANGIYEFNAGAQPDYNVYTGNNLHGCTTFLTTSGSHDVIGSNVVA